MPDPLAEAVRCRQCDTELSSARSAAPAAAPSFTRRSCEPLAGEAEQAEQKGDFSGAMAAWRRALELLPPGTRQQELIAARVGGISFEGARPFGTRRPLLRRRRRGVAIGRAGGLGWCRRAQWLY